MSAVERAGSGCHTMVVDSLEGIDFDESRNCFDARSRRAADRMAAGHTAVGWHKGLETDSRRDIVVGRAGIGRPSSSRRLQPHPWHQRQRTILEAAAVDFHPLEEACRGNHHEVHHGARLCRQNHPLAAGSRPFRGHHSLGADHPLLEMKDPIVIDMHHRTPLVTQETRDHHFGKIHREQCQAAVGGLGPSWIVGFDQQQYYWYGSRDHVQGGTDLKESCRLWMAETVPIRTSQTVGRGFHVHPTAAGSRRAGTATLSQLKDPC